MTYLFNKLHQVYVGSNKPFDKCIYTFGSSGYCHSPQKNSYEGNMVPKNASFDINHLHAC